MTGIRLVTWNVQGSARPDPARLAAELARLEPDVIALQEVQRDQAARVGGLLGMAVVWHFKHWSLVHRPEGLAVLTRAAPVATRRAWLWAPLRPWSWRRRVALAARTPPGTAPAWVCNVHLGSQVAPRTRRREVARLGRFVDSLAETGSVVVAGDLNVEPDSEVLAVLAQAGYRDAWPGPGAGPGSTNWSGPDRSESPDQRLDYVLVGPGVRALAARVPGPTEVPALARVSDHLPLAVDLIAVSAPRSADPDEPTPGQKW